MNNHSKEALEGTVREAKIRLIHHTGCFRVNGNQPFLPSRRAFLTSLASVLVFASSVVISGAAEIIWTNTVGGNWNAAANWSPNAVPGLNDNVFVTNSGTYTVVFNANATVKTLTLGSDSGIQTLSNNANSLTVSSAGSINSNGVFILGGGALAGTNTVTGVLNWTGGQVNGALTVASNATLNISGTATKNWSSVLVTNYGAVMWTGSGTLAAHTAQIYNQPGAVFELQNDQLLQNLAASVFRNSGVVRKMAGSATSTIQLLFHNTGVVTNQIGTMAFTGGGTLDGTFGADTGATINFAIGSFTLNAMPGFVGAGTVQFTGVNTTFIYFTVPISNYTLTGGNLAGTNTVTGVLNWTGGQVNGVLTVASNATLNLSGTAVKNLSSATLTNWGTVVWTGSGPIVCFAGPIYNQPGAVFDMQNDQLLQNANSSFFYNAGLLRKTAGSGTSTIQLPLQNTGTVTNQTGTLAFTGGGTLNGTFGADTGATINFAIGSFTLNAMPGFVGAGTVQFTGASGIYFTVPISDFTLTGGTLLGTNVVAVGGVLNWTGGSISGALTVASNATLNLSGTAARSLSSVLVTNWGTVVWAGSSTINCFSTQIYNQPGAVFDIQNDQLLQNNNSSIFYNAGLVRKTAGSATSTIQLPLQNTGTVTNQTGTLAFTGGGTLNGTFGADTGATINFAIGSFTLNAMPGFVGAGTVQFTGASSIYFTVPISDFTLTGGNLAGTNTVTGVLNWTSGVINGALTVASNAALNISGPAIKYLSLATVTNWGTVVWTGNGPINCYYGPIYNQPGAVFDLQNDQVLQHANSSIFYNAGLVRKTAGSGTSTIQLPLQNTGVVTNQTGTLAFTGGGTLNGTFGAEAGATINFANGSFTLNAMPGFVGAGTVQFTGFNTTLIYFTVPISDFTLTGGNLAGTNTVTGVLNWTGGVINGALTVASNATLNIGGPAVKYLSLVVVTNWGTMVWTGNGPINCYYGPIYNQPGAVFDLQNDQVLQHANSSIFYNAGLLRKAAGSGTSTIQLPLQNTGVVTNQTGTLAFTGGGTLGGTFGAEAAATINFAGGIFTVNVGTPDFSGAGIIQFTSSGQAQFTVPLANFTLTGGTLSGTNGVSGVLNWTGGVITGALTVGSNAAMNISGPAIKYLSQVTVTNWGTVVWTGSGSINSYYGQIYNQPGAVFDIQNDQLLQNANSSIFYNAGLVHKTAGSGTSTIQLPFFNTGVLRPDVGTLWFNAGNLNLLGAGLTQTTIQGQTLGSQFGQIANSGSVQLGGTLNINFTNSFVPSVGDSFRILTWATKRGGFTSANGLDLGGGLYLQGIADRSGLTLVTKSSVVPVPSPPTNLVDRVVAFGDTAMFAFSPLGVEPLTFQWTRYGTNLPGQTNASLVIPNVSALETGTYCAVVTDAFFVTNIYCADLLAIVPASITGHPVDVVTNSGNSFTLNATASGAAPLRYQWRINGENIPGATNSTYSITNASPRNGGLYSVLVANPVRVISSSNAKVKINTTSLAFADNFAARGTISGLTGVGSGNNTNTTSEVGEPKHAGKTGGHSIWLQWTAPAKGVASFGTRGSAFDTLLAVYLCTNASPAISNLTEVAADEDRAGYFTSDVVFNAEAGTNYFIAVDGLTGRSGDIVLGWNLDTNIAPFPRIIQHPESVTTTAGGVASFNVFAVSTTNLTYQWYLDGWLAIPGATNSSLTVSNVSYLDAGMYGVEVTSATGQSVASLPANLEIGPQPDAQSFDKLDDLLANISGGLGLMRSFNLVSGGGGISTFNLTFPSVSVGTIGSQLINNFNSTTEQAEPIHSDVIGGSSRWYLLTALTNGMMVVDTLGSDVDTVLSVYTGTNIFTLQLVASDNNGAPDGVRSQVKFQTQVGKSYLIAVDGVNGAQGNIYLNWRFGIAPTQTGPAQPLATQGGESLLLQSGTSTNVTSPTYQWRRNGADIVGATNSAFAISSIQFNHVGSYSVLVSNLVGSVVNSIATVSANTALQPLMETGGFRVSGSATQSVVLQTSENLLTWTPVLTNTTTLLPVSYLDTNAPAKTEGYYRFQPWP